MIEVERKYTVDAEFELPELARPGWTVEAPHEIELHATYYDTADLRLARAHITLRRRLGGKDAGWHLKLPLGRERDEIQRPTGRAGTVPKALAELVIARTRGEALVPVAQIDTTRGVTTIRADDGTPLLEVADDRVRARRLVDGALSSWREVEVEQLTPGHAKAMAKVGRALCRAGAAPSASRSKLGQTLGTSDDTPPAPDDSAAFVVTDYFTRQVRDLLEADPGVRQGDGEAVHAMRVASRRLRSALRTFAPLLDDDRLADLTDELSWLAAALGEVRDRDVLGTRMLDQLDTLPARLATDAVRSRLLQDELAASGRRAHLALLRTLRGPRYLALLDRLDDLAGAPPLTPAADVPAAEALPPLAATAWRRFSKRAEAAIASGLDDDLHACRKAAKQARYAAEALSPALGRPAEKLARRAKAVQTLLGEHQDAVVASTMLQRLADDDQHAFAYGILWAAEQQRAKACADEFVDLWASVKPAGRRALTRLHGRAA